MTEENQAERLHGAGKLQRTRNPHDFQQSVREELFGQGIPGLYPVYSTR